MPSDSVNEINNAQRMNSDNDPDQGHNGNNQVLYTIQPHQMDQDQQTSSVVQPPTSKISAKCNPEIAPFQINCRKRKYRSVHSIFVELMQHMKTVDGQQPSEPSYTDPTLKAVNWSMFDKRKDTFIYALREYIRSPTFRLYIDSEESSSCNVAMRLSSRFLIFMHQRCIDTLSFYKYGLTDTVRGFILERVAKRNALYRTPFETKYFDLYFSAYMSNLQIFSHAKRTYGLRNKAPNRAFNLIGRDGRSMLTSFSIHMVNWFAKAFCFAEEAGSDVANTIFVHTLDAVAPRRENGTLVSFEYNFPEDSLQWFQTEIWSAIVNCLLSMTKDLGEQCVKSAPSAHKFAVIENKHDRLILRPNHLVDHNDVLTFMYTPSNVSNAWVSVFLKCVFDIFLETSVLTLDQAWSRPISSSVREALRGFFSRFTNTVLHVTSDLNEETISHVKSNTVAVFNKGMVAFDKTRSSNLPLPIMPPSRESLERNECPACEQEWPTTKEWPPPPVIRKGRKRVSIEMDADDDSDDDNDHDNYVNMSTRTRSKQPRMEDVSSRQTRNDTRGAQNIVLEGAFEKMDACDERTAEERTQAAANAVNEILTRTADVDNIIPTLQDILDVARQRAEDALNEKAEQKVRGEEHKRRKEKENKKQGKRSQGRKKRKGRPRKRL